MGLNEYIKIGNRIRQLRTSRGYSQKKMSELCGIPYSTYSNYENNNREPSLDQIEKIAKVLNVSTSVLIGYKSDLDQFSLSPINNNLFHVIRLLEEKDKLCADQEQLDKKYEQGEVSDKLAYAVEADMIQFQLGRIIEELSDYETTIAETANIELYPLAYRILFELRFLNPAGEKRILEEIDNLSYNPNYKTTKPDDWDPYEDY